MIIGPAEIRPATAASASDGALAALLAGKVIEARLLMALGGGLFRFTSGGNEFDLPLPRGLPPGTPVKITPQAGGSIEITVLGENGLPAPPTRAGQAVTHAQPPLIVRVRPTAPTTDLPVGRSVEAQIMSAPREGVVRVALPGGEAELSLPRPVPVGTRIQITPEPGGVLRVTIPAAATSPAPETPHAAPSPVARAFVFTVRPENPMPQFPAGQVIEAHVLAASREGVVRFATPAGEVDLELPTAFPEGTQARLAPQPNGTLVVTIRPEPAAVLQQGSPIVLKPGPGLPMLAPNQIIEAQVAGPVQPNGMVRLSSPAGDFDLPLPQAIPPGTSVRVTAQPNGGLTLVPLAPAPEATTAKPQTVQTSPSEAVRAAAQGAVARQGGLAPLFADMEALLQRPDVPVPVRRVVEKMLDQRLPLESVLRPERLAQAVVASGLFAERTLASLAPTQGAPPDLKLMLHILRAVLASWTSVRTDVNGRAETHLPPPAPGMPPAAQAPSEPAHPRGAGQGVAPLPPEELVPRLVRETDAVLARISLHQIASLPDERAAARADQPDMRWSCEVPVNVDGRTAMFGFVIERDGRHAPQERAKRRWRVRAAIDLAETGAVEADVRLQSGAVSAGLIVERRETAELLDAALPMLRDGLTAAGFDVDSLSVRTGKAVPQPGPPGYFMDRRT